MDIFLPSVHNPPKLRSIAEGISMVAKGCRSRAAALTVSVSDFASVAATTTTWCGFLMEAQSGSSMWIWKADGLVEGFSEQLLSSFLQDTDCEDSWKRGKTFEKGTEENEQALIFKKRN